MFGNANTTTAAAAAATTTRTPRFTSSALCYQAGQCAHVQQHA